MRLLHGWRGASALPHPSVVSIGNFDGMHLGHQAVLRELCSWARELNAQPTVVLFEPQPREFFAPQSAPTRVQNLREKLFYLRQFGIAQVLLLRFDHPLAGLSAEEFVTRIVVGRLRACGVLVGEDFRFGHARRGDITLLQTLAAPCAYVLRAAPTVQHHGRRVSSSRLRECLARADFAEARALLGRAYRLHGRVRHGDGRGHELGYPTINLALKRLRAPLSGIFAARVYGLTNQENLASRMAGKAHSAQRPRHTLQVGEEASTEQHSPPPDSRGFDDPLAGVAYVGSKGGTVTVLEVHIFDYDKNCYGQHVQVELLHKVRDDAHFDSPDALIAQMHADARAARNYFQPQKYYE